jgi:hypothetical protein
LVENYEYDEAVAIVSRLLERVGGGKLS